eukprot:766005-Prorocentrum_minimum.AAC.2
MAQTRVFPSPRYRYMIHNVTAHGRVWSLTNLVQWRQAANAAGAEGWSEKGVLQLLFDVRFLADILKGGVNDPAPALRLEEALTARLDPIDWATYEPYLWANEQRFYQVYSHGRPIRRRKHWYILTADQSDSGTFTYYTTRLAYALCGSLYLYVLRDALCLTRPSFAER